ncbi:hypothetical protein CRYUN_Cryun03dG0014100 [Craigia yunnanensis]
MECVGARNFAAMAVSTCATWRYRRRNLMRTKTALSSNHRFISFKVRASEQGAIAAWRLRKISLTKKIT